MSSGTLARLSGRSVLAAYVSSLPTVCGLVAVGVLYRTRPETWPGIWGLLLVGVLIGIRLLIPLVRWLTVRYLITAEVLCIERGLWVRRRVSASWDSVVVKETAQPWVYRVLGLMIVTLHVGGENTEGGDFTIAGVDASTATSFVQVGAKVPRPESRPDEPQLPDPTRRGESVVYRATVSQLLVGGLAQGQLLVGGAFAVYAVIDLLQTFGLWDAQAYLGLGAQFVVVVVGFSVLILGTVVLLVKYHKLNVTRNDEEIIFRYGILDRRERIIHPTGLVGFRVHRNAIEMLLDRVRIVLLTQDATVGRGSNVVLPSLPRGAMAEILHSIDEDSTAVTVLSTNGKYALGRTSIAVLAILAIGVAVTFTLDSIDVIPTGWPVLGGILAVGLFFPFYRLVSTRVSVSDKRALARQHHLYERQQVLRASAIHLISRVSVGTCQFQFLRIFYYAGIGKSVSAFSRRADTYRELTQSIKTSAGEMAGLRRGSRGETGD